jgi:hypothetical protein
MKKNLLMNNLSFIAGIVGLAGNIPLIIGIYRNKVKQNFIAWMLWALLDCITTASIIFQHGNFFLPLGYTFGSVSVATLLFFKKEISWTWFEMFVTILVVLCIIAWGVTGERGANIAGVSAICIAAFPLIKDTWHDPQATPTGIYCIFAVANILSIIAGKSWTIEEELYPVAVLSFTVLLVILSLRKPKIKVITGVH